MIVEIVDMSSMVSQEQIKMQNTAFWSDLSNLMKKAMKLNLRKKS